MPTRDENRSRWTGFDWSRGGDEWSLGWGSSAMLWHGTILPRIHFLLPARHLLEIAPGFGRVTEFLLHRCERYTGVDLTARCVEACRERFRDRAGAEFVLNDGASLACAADASIDAAVSWDSLVHADAAALAGYVRELARVLVPGGRAFLHHSNLAAFAGDPRVPAEDPHWRDRSTSAELVRELAAGVGLVVDAQELVQWGSEVESDAFTWLRRPAPGAARAAPGPLRTHPSFSAEIAHFGWLAEVAARGES